MSHASSAEPRAPQPFHLAFPVTSLHNALEFKAVKNTSRLFAK